MHMHVESALFPALIIHRDTAVCTYWNPHILNRDNVRGKAIGIFGFQH